MDLLATGLLDSLALITLPDGLEDLGIVLQPTQLGRDALRTPEKILHACRLAAHNETNVQRVCAYACAEKWEEKHA